jgi:hypothetical protein
MGRARSMDERDEKCAQNFDQKTWREKTTWKTSGVDGDNIKIYLKE